MSQSVFKKRIWDHFMLHCEHCRWNAWNYSVDYRRRSRTPAVCKTKLLVSIARNFQPLTIVTKNSILGAAVPKLYFILICFCFKWFLQNIMFMHFRSIQKILSNWYKIRKSIEFHWKSIDMVSISWFIQTDYISLPIYLKKVLSVFTFSILLQGAVKN